MSSDMLLHTGVSSQKLPSQRELVKKKYFLYSFSCCLIFLLLLFSPCSSAEAFRCGQLSSVVMLVSVSTELLCVTFNSRKEKYLKIYFRGI